MIENVKLYSKIATKSFLKWLAIVVTGYFVTLVLFLIVLFQNNEIIGGGHGNPIAFLSGLFTSNMPAFLLIVGTPLFIVLYFIVANKYAIGLTIYQIWKNKAESFVGDGVRALMNKMTESNRNLSTISNDSILRLRLLDENRKNPNSTKIQRNIIGYIIKKIKLNDIDFTDKNLRLSDIVANKVNNFISENSQPSLTFFWILIIIQIILFITSQFY